eukprot:12888852-Prorocentrum_lima.AAC.1
MFATGTATLGRRWVAACCNASDNRTVPKAFLTSKVTSANSGLHFAAARTAITCRCAPGCRLSAY